MHPSRFLLLTVLLLGATMAPAQAYIDGGSAHLLVQGLIAAVVGVLYYVKNPREIWKAIRRRWKRDSE